MILRQTKILWVDSIVVASYSRV